MLAIGSSAFRSVRRATRLGMYAGPQIDEGSVSLARVFVNVTRAAKSPETVRRLVFKRATVGGNLMLSETTANEIGGADARGASLDLPFREE